MLSDQDEFFVVGQRNMILDDSFAYLEEDSYASQTTVRTVPEAASFLPEMLRTVPTRVIVVLVSGLRYDAFGVGTSIAAASAGVDDEEGGTVVAPFSSELASWRDSLGSDAVLCKLRSEVPSLDVPNWLAILMGVRPEIHGLLGNRGPAEQEYSSLYSVLNELSIDASLIANPWLVDLVRSQLPPLGGDGSVSASHVEFEALDPSADEHDARRENALQTALRSSARLVVAQLSQVDTAAYNFGVSYRDGAPYAQAVADKTALLSDVTASQAEHSLGPEGQVHAQHVSVLVLPRVARPGRADAWRPHCT